MAGFESVATSSGLTIATTGYTAKDVLGAVMTFTSVPTANGGDVWIESCTVVDKANVLGPLELHLFNTSPTTQGADNAAYAISDAEALNLIAIIPIYVVASGTNNRLGDAQLGLPKKVRAGAATTSLFGVLVTLATHTFFGAVGDIQVRLAGTRDG